MKSDFLLAITQLSAEKNLPKDVILQAVESALVSAYKKDSLTSGQNISVKINSSTGEVKVYAQKLVTDTVTDPRVEISMADARRITKGIQLGETVQLEIISRNAGRIAAQTAKQVVLQRLKEAERDAIYVEFVGREGDVISGVIQRIEPKQVFIDLGRTEAVLPSTEQVRGERYRIGQRLKLYLLEASRTGKGPQVIVSRSHPNLLRRLFELEIPEIHNGQVEVKAIAWEAGNRGKVAVAARQQGVDPVGCCVGQRGIRIQNIVNELGGIKLDVVQWHATPATFIASALSPAQVSAVKVDNDTKTATVIVPDRQLSLAIGKEGQNARLAAKLTGWRIDIKSASVAQAEQAEAAKTEVAVPAPEPVAEAEKILAEAAAVETEKVPGKPQKVSTEASVGEAEKILAKTTATEAQMAAQSAPEPLVASPVAQIIPEVVTPQAKVVEAEPVEEVVEEVFFEEVKPSRDKTQIRFAEDLSVVRGIVPEGKAKKVKKKGHRARQNFEEYSSE
jgi:transcription termination/antitermination protein NusA